MQTVRYRFVTVLYFFDFFQHSVWAKNRKDRVSARSKRYNVPVMRTESSKHSSSDGGSKASARPGRKRTHRARGIPHSNRGQARPPYGTPYGAARKASPKGERSRGDSLDALRSVSMDVVFFGLFFFYIRFVVDLRFFYSSGGAVTNFPVYFKGWAFFRDFLSRPGGPLEYVAALLCQLFYIGWAGALVVTLQALLMTLCVGYILRTVNLPGLRWLRFAPPIILLITYNQYTFYFVTTTAFLAALLFTCFYLRATPGLALNRVRPAVFLVLSVILYYFTGGAYLLFAILCAIHELLLQRRLLPGLLCLLSAAVVPYITGVTIFGVSTVGAFSDLMPFSWKILAYQGRRRLIGVVYALYLFLPSIMMASAVWQNVLSPGINVRIFSRRKKSKSGPGLRILRPVIESITIFGIGSAAVLLSYDAEKRTLYAVHYYACHRMWPQVLDAAGRYTDNSAAVNAVNRALYHTGRLGYDMFRWPQHPDALLRTGKDQMIAYWQKFDTQFDLGLMNMAEKNFTECMEVLGENPMILKRLAMINLVKANYDSARIYLGKLSKTLFHADWANDYLSRLQSDPNLTKDHRIQHLRLVCMKTDDPTIFFSKERALCDLLVQNKSNKMAFEYLTAWYMLTRQLEKTVQMVEHLKDYDYKELPGLYEETLLIYVYGTKKVVNLGGYRVSHQARQRIEQFSYVFNRYGKNKKAAYAELARDYGNSYFFYHIYGFSGVGK